MTTEDRVQPDLVLPSGHTPADRSGSSGNDTGEMVDEAGQGHADRLHDQAAPGRGAPSAPRRGQPGPAAGDLRRVHPGAGIGTVAGPAGGVGSHGLPFGDDTTPSEAELRVAQAQLVGWLEGLFHGIQATLFAQQMAARNQLEEMRRRGLPGGSDDRAPMGGTYL